MEPIQDDMSAPEERIRAVLEQALKDATYARDAGYGGEHARVIDFSNALAALRDLEVQVESLREERQANGTFIPSEFLRAMAERPGLVAERDRLLAGIEALVEKWRPYGLYNRHADELEALTKTTEEEVTDTTSEDG